MVIVRNKEIRKGSLTIEAACVMPLILLVLMGLLYLCFFVHNRAWLTAAACEAAVSGSMEAIRQDGQVYEAARMQSEALGSSGFFGAENLSTQTHVGRNVSVTYDLDTIAGYGGLAWHLRVEGQACVVRPVNWIRKIKAAADLMKGIGD